MNTKTQSQILKTPNHFRSSAKIPGLAPVQPATAMEEDRFVVTFAMSEPICARYRP